ncbi:MAG: hybrid cluSPTER protein-associated redox disulfide domain protein [Firmicutes bacterium]|nr:hybrid cluSPTER protein-associated redox disulfide domain protein [Bacillota bacterium]
MAVTKETSIREVVSKYPNTVSVFRKYGMGCFVCAAASYENIEQGAYAHEVDSNVLLAEINKVIQEE